jgi:hypothetical protein
MLVDAFNDLILLLRGQLIDIPLNNGLAVAYVILNIFLSIGALFLGGEVRLPGLGGGGGL